MLKVVVSSFYEEALFNFHFEGDKSPITNIIDKPQPLDKIKEIINESNDQGINLIISDFTLDLSFADIKELHDVIENVGIEVVVVTSNLLWFCNMPNINSMYMFVSTSNFSDVAGYNIIGDKISSDMYSLGKALELSETIRNIIKSTRINITFPDINNRRPEPVSQYPEYKLTTKDEKPLSVDDRYSFTSRSVIVPDTKDTKPSSYNEAFDKFKKGCHK